MDRIERPSLIGYWTREDDHGRWSMSLWDQGRTLPAKCTCLLKARLPIEMMTVNVSMPLGE
jgi:hypothetical protein